MLIIDMSIPHSIMIVMTLAAGFGTPITFTIAGGDAHQAMAAVHRLFAMHFAEACRTSTAPASLSGSG